MRRCADCERIFKEVIFYESRRGKKIREVFHLDDVILCKSSFFIICECQETFPGAFKPIEQTK